MLCRTHRIFVSSLTLLLGITLIASDHGHAAAAPDARTGPLATQDQRDDRYAACEEHRRADRLDEAAAALHEVLAYDRKHAEPATVADTLEDLAGLDILRDRLGAAWTSAWESLKLRTEHFGSDHWSVKSAQSLLYAIDRLARLEPADRIRRSELERQFVVHFHQGAFGRAIPPAVEIERIERRVLAADQPYYANTWLNVGNCQFHLENYQQAQLLYRQALEAYEKSLGEDHPLVALACYCLGEVHEATGDRSQAADYYRRAVEIRGRTLAITSFEYRDALAALLRVLSPVQTESIQQDVSVNTIE
jgi:tetratricopeptide (TPR) repeat protein